MLTELCARRARSAFFRNDESPFRPRADPRLIQPPCATSSSARLVRPRRRMGDGKGAHSAEGRLIHSFWEVGTHCAEYGLCRGTGASKRAHSANRPLVDTFRVWATLDTTYSRRDRGSCDSRFPMVCA